VLSELELVIVDVLSVTGQSRQDQGPLSAPNRRHHRAHAGMGNDRIRPAYVGGQCIRLQVVDPPGIKQVGPRGGRAVLDHQLVHRWQLRH